MTSERFMCPLFGPAPAGGGATDWLAMPGLHRTETAK